MILLSDGLETQGNAAAFVHTLAGERIRLDAFLPVAEEAKKEAEIRSFQMPAQISLGQACVANVSIQSNCAMGADLVLLEEGEALLMRSVELNEGVNTFSMNINPKQAGMRKFSAELRPAEDVIVENNIQNTL